VNWGSLDDVVMGGVSESGLYLSPGSGPDGCDAAVFSGNVSTDNNGGFASVRALDCMLHVWQLALASCQKCAVARRFDMLANPQLC
jgi:Complex I intermediate-associated protein 30 (CIA30)